MAVKFFAPDGLDQDDVSADYLESLVLRRDPEFWESGSGDAAIRFTDGSAEGELVLMVRDPYGVFVQYTEFNSGTEWILSGGDDETDTIIVTQNGDPWKLPRTFFVDRSIAASVVAEFARSGKRPTCGNWVLF